MPSLTVIIPAYNEAESLPRVLPEVVAFCRRHGYQLIVTNDGSRDATGKILDALPREDFVRVIHHKVNRGYGGAIKSAIRAATTDHVITIDADGQHVLDDIPRLHARLVAEDADLVVGNRDANPQGLYRRFGKSIIRAVAKVLMPLHVRDINSGIKVYDTALAQKYIRLCPDSMSYSDTITLVFVARRHRVVEEPVSLNPRAAGTSTISSRTAVETLLEILNIIVLFNPMRVFLPLALAFAGFGIAWNVPIFLRGEGVSVGSMMLIVSGLLFFLLGLITEVLSNLRMAAVDGDER